MCSRRNPHGIVSIALVYLAFGVGALAIGRERTVGALLYTALVLASPFLIALAFCARCPCRFGGCAHVLMGLIARRLPARQGSRHRPIELAGLMAVLAPLVLLPQPWLWASPLLLVAFWILVGAAAVEIRLRVCPSCGFAACPAKRATRSIGATPGTVPRPQASKRPDPSGISSSP